MIASKEQRRFWTKVDIRGDDECWPWTACALPTGYGTFWANGKHARAHRFALESAMEAPLGDLFALHSCDNPSCCNPAHLRPGTHRENVADCVAKGRNTKMFGANNGLSKLTEEDVRAIRAKFASGVLRSALALQYGMGWSTISSICKGQHWPAIRAPRTEREA